LPRYVRGKVGIVHCYRGGFVFADDNAMELGKNRQHVYSVLFEGRELWGEDAEDNTGVCLDMYESYLEPVS
jgi:nitrile hydratase